MKKLKIYFTSDMHGYIYPTDYTNNDEKPIGMLNLINSFNKNDNTLIIDGGDTIQGSPFTTYLNTKNFKTHPISNVINEGKYDYITLGNHDFNYGYENLYKYLNNINAKCLCCNIKDITNTLPIIPYDIKILPNGLKIGIIGITTDYISIWEKKENINNFEINDVETELKKYYKEIKDNCDISICVYHGGFEKDLNSGNILSTSKENIGYKICEDFNFDLLLSGHQHMCIEGQYINKTYVVQTPHNASQFIEVNLNWENKIIQIDSKLKQTNINPNEPVYHELLPYEKEVQKWLDTPVGHLNIPLHPLNHIEMALNGTPLANFINTIQIDATGADISCTSFANTIKGFNKDVTVRDIVSTYPYPNTLVVLDVSYEILKKALNKCATYFSYNGDEITISNNFLKPKIEHYNFDYYKNIEYSFIINKNSENEVGDIFYKGKKLQKGDSLSLVMNNYRASGGGGYEFFRNCKVIMEVQIEMPEIIIGFFEKYKNITVDEKKYFTYITK